MRAFIIAAMITMGCNTNKTANVKEFIPGVYSRHYEGQYSIGDDTLLISQVDGGNLYMIIRKSRFHRLTGKKKNWSEQTVENWSAVYNARDKILYEQKRERMLSFVPDSNKMFVGSSAYFKNK